MSDLTNESPDMDEVKADVVDMIEVADAVDAGDAAATDEVVAGDEAGEPEEALAGPEEYTEREKTGRSRRVSNDVKLDDIDFKNVSMLSRFIDRRGRILSRRKTRVSAKMQRRIEREIKRARHLALLPYTGEQSRIVRKRR
jgi:small subunit ribosomal protein S18